MMQIGLIGFGFVGKAMYKLFPTAIIYDKNNPVTLRWKTKLSDQIQERNVDMQDINTCDVAFVCVPTDLKNGKLDMSIVEEVISQCTCPLIVIRSTLMPGACEALTVKYKKNIVYQPEYLGESVEHPFLDLKTRPFLIIAGEQKNRRKLIELYQSVYNANIKIRQTDFYTAEVIKLSENRAIAFKVAQCQELYDACEKAGLDYYEVREAVYGDDPRFTLWWTFVYPEKRGFQSKCLPKDVYGWCAWAESVGIKPELTKKMLEINEKYVKGKK